MRPTIHIVKIDKGADFCILGFAYTTKRIFSLVQFSSLNTKGKSLTAKM